MMQLPDVREVLAFEATAQHEPHWWKERAVRARWNISSARYHQVLNRIIDIPQAVLLEPQLVLRLQRLREQRRSKRHARRIA